MIQELKINDIYNDDIPSDDQNTDFYRFCNEPKETNEPNEPKETNEPNEPNETNETNEPNEPNEPKDPKEPISNKKNKKIEIKIKEGSKYLKNELYEKAREIKILLGGGNSINISKMNKEELYSFVKKYQL